MDVSGFKNSVYGVVDRHGEPRPVEGEDFNRYLAIVREYIESNARSEVRYSWLVLTLQIWNFRIPTGLVLESHTLTSVHLMHRLMKRECPEQFRKQTSVCFFYWPWKIITGRAGCSF